MPKKSRITVVQNDKGEDVSTCLTTGWRVCINYRRLNAVTRKDHFPLPFIDQEKTTFTYPFGTYAYMRMPFGLCNAPTTFQRCMLSIFSDMVERIMEVFMDDITIYGSAFDECLVNLEVVLNRCIEKDLVLNWEKCHFIVQQGIVLGHIISKFYRRFIKDFSKLARPLCELLVKDAKFIWDDKCQRSFEELKLFLTTAPIVRVPIGNCPLRESLMLVEVAPWYAHIANYLVIGEVPSEWKAQYKKRATEDPHHCHENACGGHFASQKTTMRVLQSGFYWPSLFKDAHTICKSGDRCQRGIDFMGPFPMSFGCSYILVGVDYVSKWVEVVPCKHNDHRVDLKFLKESIFSRFGVPKSIISDGGTHFCNKPFETLLAKYGVKYKVATPYHPQTSGQVELANREIKNILMKVVITNKKDCLWQSMPSPCGIGIQAWWAIKKLNMDLSRAGGDFKVVGHVLKDSWQRKNPEEKNSPRHFTHPCENFASYYTRATASHPQSSVQNPLAKRARTSSPGESSKVSQYEPLLLHMLELLQILSFLPTCHRGLLSDAQCSQHRPLRATQITNQDLSTQSSILIRRSSNRSLSFETLMAYYKVHDYSWRLSPTSIHFTIDGHHGILRLEIL
ncbi:Retrovirus-related Pol polyprotein from transposon 17.6 [Vitis vinifera]|uniref:Retrovirus-related Pol polyprotein from transposon 17.6 n=1 Tax=Vitis vinifera TaxID=29760 RepID=A0A438C669_VITVI|nr:Retrovirus-related Pol polyprotein from transposon 17.6 [Vitis vinifera]